ncbi:hypothetical protein CDV31_013931 [Fusarium ambrosium]|uniref:SnoaL-like domain-containing protein n=1 Tax=Fusarium ambrosium TaxID=131363 RepID=A0A428SZW8_9HYPO|nr:hypothetical protein CDV31_013931 [Fusarium ambrosium]
MSSTDQPSAPTFKSIGITNTDIRKAAGVQLTPHQEVLIGSVLDLFEGHPSLRHLSLWTPTATFHDPITNAIGFDKFAAQWYGLVALFSPITIQSHEVTSSGDPISLRLSNKYVLKGLGTEKVMDSVVNIHVGPDGRIEKVEDKWNDKLPQGPFATATDIARALDTQAFQKLNAVSVPAFVKVPKTQEEDDQMRADRAREAQT